MKAQKIFRLVHHWGSIIVAIPLVIMTLAGLVLMVKKEISWIQPPTLKGSAPGEMPHFTIADLYHKAADASFKIGKVFPVFAALDRVDVKPDKGTVKFITSDGLEVQVDMATGAVLQIAVRQSDWFEKLHDGSLFANWVKFYIFLPAGIILFFLWATGLYLFILTEYKKARSRSKRKINHARSR